MKKLYDQIKELLEKHPALRDSDKALMVAIWSRQGLVRGDGSIDYEDFIHTAKNPESIRRARQKVQENNHKLRSSKRIQREKDKKESTKGNFVYHEKLN